VSVVFAAREPWTPICHGGVIYIVVYYSAIWGIKAPGIDVVTFVIKKGVILLSLFGKVTFPE
jgi:hypothetical protein